MPRTSAPRPVVVALLRACKELPDEEVHRLVLADWLEENATDPAETALRDLIRLQVQFDRLSDDNKRLPLAAEASSLLDHYGRKWLGSLDTDRVNWGLQHGLFVMTCQEEDLSRSRLGTPGFPEGWEWVERLTVLCTEGSNYKAMAQAEPLGHIGTLDLHRNTLRRAGLEAVAQSERLRNLCGLVLSHTDLARSGLEVLMASPYLHNLNRLELSGNMLEARAAPILAGWPGLQNLTRLALSHNPLGDRGVEIILQSGATGALRQLHLSCCSLETAGGLASAKLHELRELDLSHNNKFDADALRGLLQADWPGKLQRLSLSFTSIDDNGVKLLANCPALSSLVRLDLQGVRMKAKTINALDGSKHLPNLALLDLRNERVSGWNSLRDDLRVNIIS
jgi:uncharacterized protein (TIGR02996 family)